MVEVYKGRLQNVRKCSSDGAEGEASQGLGSRAEEWLGLGLGLGLG